MTAPNIESSTREERLDYVLNEWRCLHNCEPMEQREQKTNLFGLCRVVTEEDEVSTLGMFTAARCALKGQKCQNTSVSYPCFCPCRAHFIASTHPGRRPGLCACCPFGAHLERLLPFRDRPFLLAKLELRT